MKFDKYETEILMKCVEYDLPYGYEHQLNHLRHQEFSTETCNHGVFIDKGTCAVIVVWFKQDKKFLKMILQLYNEQMKAFDPNLSEDERKRTFEIHKEQYDKIEKEFPNEYFGLFKNIRF